MLIQRRRGRGIKFLNKGITTSVKYGSNLIQALALCRLTMIQKNKDDDGTLQLYHLARDRLVGCGAHREVEHMEYLMENWDGLHTTLSSPLRSRPASRAVSRKSTLSKKDKV